MLERDQVTEVAKPKLVTGAHMVFGGAGFIGSHLCERLLREGHNVVCLDNFSSGALSNVEHLVANGLSILQHDITEPLRHEGTVAKIYNLACPASPLTYQMAPIQTTKTSVLGAINVLELAREHDVPVLQASTSEVYGDPLHHPQRETDWGNVNPIGPRACYDEGKRCAETLFFDYHRVHGVKIRIARIFNTYGPRMAIDDGRVVSNFVVAALQNKPLTIYGAGDQTRSFCYVDDLVEGVLRLMNASDEVTGPINLGNTRELAIKELAELVINLTNSRSRIVHLSQPADDPGRRKPDIDRAAETLDWHPTISLETGLLRTIDYFDLVLKEVTLAL